MQLFYAPDLNGSTYLLSPEESKHCTRVLRKSKGDEVLLTDGRGSLFETVLIDDAKDHCVVEVTRQIENYGKRPYRVHLAVAPTKNTDRYEWFVEKATEIGIDRIVPLVCEHSERISIKTERLERLAIAAMKQSLKTLLPEIATPTSFADLMQEYAAEPSFQKLVAYCPTGEEALLSRHLRPASDVLLLIGPEGDFSEAEIRMAAQQGFLNVSLGKSRLRTETAALTALTAVHLIAGEL